ncbi:hypothetical protein LCGC14_3030670 [marine sediment metagenome]|uniref:Uncharacterized protein n=1 Tax=marine sediment metagenome TaxID=412755 RepID=A0A0F8ZIM3_9ZZZZ
MSHWDLRTPLLTDDELGNWETEVIRDVVRAQAAKIVEWLEDNSVPYEPTTSYELEQAIEADLKFPLRGGLLKPRAGRIRERSTERPDDDEIAELESTDEHTAI